MKRFAASVSAPPDYAAVGLLAAASSVVGAARMVSPWDGWREYPALWVLMVGSPSSSKSPVFAPIVAALKDIEREEGETFPEVRRRYETDKRGAHEVKTNWEASVTQAVKAGHVTPLKPEAADEPDEPKPPRMVVSDATVESLAPLFKANPRGLLLARDELAGWIGNFGKYGGDGDAAFFLERFTGQPVTVDRVKAGNTTADRGLLSVFGGVQPERMNELLLKRADDGFVSRFLFAFPDPVARVRPTDHADMAVLKAALRRLRGLAFTIDGDQPAPRVLPLTAAATTIFHEWWRENGEAGAAAAGFTAGSLGKGPGLVLRIALLLELLEWSAGPSWEREAVGEVALYAACRLFDDYFVPMAARVFGGSNRRPEDISATVFLRHIRDAGEGTVNARALARLRLPARRSADQVRAALDVLAEGGWCRFAGGREGDRPGVQRGDWEINPLLWGARP
ncbi:MAG: DUF3987 domain-containing protein [Caulobacteraceae bacterium]